MLMGGHGIIFGAGYSESAYLYTDTTGAVGFFSTTSAATSIGVPAVTNITESYSVDYERAAGAVKPTTVNKVFTNGVEVAETIHLNNYWRGGMTDYPILGSLSSNGVRARGVLKSLRIYDRSLTEAERSLNAALDFLRYGTGSMPEEVALDGYLADTSTQNLLVRVRVRSAGGALSVNGSEPMHDGTFWVPIGSAVTVSGKFKGVRDGRIGAYIREGLPSGAVVSEDGRKVTFTVNEPVSVRIGHPDVMEGFMIKIR
jgi:hypothetical protein